MIARIAGTMFFAAVVISFVLLAVNVVHAHSWYSNYCCNNKDCYPINYTPRAVPGGWEAEGKVFTRKMMRGSADGKWHVCILGGRPRCLYAPLGM